MPVDFLDIPVVDQQEISPSSVEFLDIAMPERKQFKSSASEFQRFAQPLGLGSRPNTIPLESGEIFPLKAVERLVESRGQADPSSLFQKFQEAQGFFPKAGAAIDLMTFPQTLAESAVAGPMMSLQRGRPQDAFEAFKQGITGQKRAEFGDVVRSTGLVPGEVSSSVGLGAAIVAPITKSLQAIKKFKGFGKLTDSQLIKSGEDIVKASDEALEALGKNLEQAYEPVKGFIIKSDKILDDIAELPPKALKYIERELGSTIDDTLSEFTVEKARRLKGLIGEFRSGAFGKEARGVAETVDDKLINRVYSNIKNNMQDTLNSAGLKKEAKRLLEADEQFSQASRASQFLRRKVVDTVLKEPTKAGRLTGSVDVVKDATARRALNILSKSGGKVQDKLIKATNNLDRIAASEDFKKFLFRSAGIGATGAVAGSVAGSLTGRGRNQGIIQDIVE